MRKPPHPLSLVKNHINKRRRYPRHVCIALIFLSFFFSLERFFHPSPYVPYPMLKTLFLASSFVAAAVAQQQCVAYASSFTFPTTEYPVIWTQPNTTQFNTAEYQALYNSIDWTKAPNITPNKMDASGNFISTGYPTTDPDCWWTYNGCVTPKAAGVNPDIYICPEPGRSKGSIVALISKSIV